MEIMYFYLLALVAVVSGFLVVTCKSPINNAIALMMTFVCLANFYVMLNAPFMAAIQIMVYAGAILMLIIFTIMLLNLGTAVARKGSHSVGWATVLAAMIFGQIYYLLNRGRPMDMINIKKDFDAAAVAQIGHTELIAESLFTKFLLPFEIASILLLVAIVGAVVLAKKEV
ncbi:MAG: NADH-quinone oxidoreductase subunit J [Desulfuromonas sp.]|nr:MAG: NADH-quinone oxidoreductase subunit J [Desulfuromonas sp.]